MALPSTKAVVKDRLVVGVVDKNKCTDFVELSLLEVAGKLSC